MYLLVACVQNTVQSLKKQTKKSTPAKMSIKTYVTHSKYPSRAAMCSGVSPCMLTEAREQPEFSTSSAISTFPAYAAQWRQTFCS